MPTSIRSVEYFYATVKDKPGEVYRTLSRMAAGEVNLLAFNAVPMGGDTTHLVLFPELPERLFKLAERSGMVLTGPQHAFLIRGDDDLGALVDLHQQLADAHINVVTASGVTDGKGGYGYILHVRPEDFDKATQILGV